MTARKVTEDPLRTFLAAAWSCVWPIALLFAAAFGMGSAWDYAREVDYAEEKLRATTLELGDMRATVQDLQATLERVRAGKGGQVR